MTTFSQLVDELVTEIRRPDMRVEIATYLNQTIREMHFDPTSGAAAQFKDNLLEDQAVATVENGYVWDLPNPALFQQIAAVRFDSIFVNDESSVYIRERTPGPGLSGQCRFWYRTGPGITFHGYGGVGGIITIAWFEFPRALKYYPAANRPASWDIDLGWSYDPAFDTTDELRASARFFTTNWMLERWSVIVAEGLRAKVYKRISDTERARTAFSAYTTLRKGVYTSESSVRG
jgi:hypothetical protein